MCSLVRQSSGFELNHHGLPAEGEEDVGGVQELRNPENETARSSLEELHAECAKGSRSASEEVVSTSRAQAPIRTSFNVVGDSEAARGRGMSLRASQAL